MQKLKSGRDAARVILSRYPDYGKAPPEYLAGIAELIASLDDAVVLAMVNIRTGISARCKYLPTQADFVAFADEFEEKRYAVRDLRKGRVPEPIVNTKASPFPKLTAAFSEEPQLLARTFECLAQASKAFATQGIDAARGVLAQGRPVR